MSKSNTKRIAGTVAIVALWTGVVIFALTSVFPALQRLSALREELSYHSSTLQERLRKGELPAQGRIEAKTQAKEAMRSELDRSNEFFLKLRERVLERSVLDTEDGDPYHVAARFRELKSSLEEKAGTEGFLDLGEVSAWAQQPDGRPDPDQFRLLEKKSNIATTLVDLLHKDQNGGGGALINELSIGRPHSPPEMPEIPGDESDRGVRFRLLPIDLSIELPFDNIGPMMQDLLYVSPEEEKLFLAVRSIELERSEEDDTAEYTALKLELNVLDFYIPE